MTLTGVTLTVERIERALVAQKRLVTIIKRELHHNGIRTGAAQNALSPEGKETAHKISFSAA